MEGDGRGGDVVVVEGHDGVDAVCEGGDGVLFEHELGRDCGEEGIKHSLCVC